jgi:hypothetical protein
MLEVCVREYIILPQIGAALFDVYDGDADGGRSGESPGSSASSGKSFVSSIILAVAVMWWKVSDAAKSGWN